MISILTSTGQIYRKYFYTASLLSVARDVCYNECLEQNVIHHSCDTLEKGNFTFEAIIPGSTLSFCLSSFFELP